MIELSAGKLWGMRRMADAGGFFKMTAVDQRPPIQGPIARYYGTPEAPYDDVAGFKALLLETLQTEASAMLLDPHFAIPRGLHLMSPQKGLIVTLEDSRYEETPDGRFSMEIDHWSVAKIKRMGGDAVKVLAWYRPDVGKSAEEHQKDFVKRIGEACQRFDIPFLFELLVYPLAGDAHQTNEYIEMRGKRADHVLRSVEVFADPAYGIDVFKLESPVNAETLAEDDAEAQALFAEMGRLAGRPWVMLSAGAGKEAFRTVLSHAFRAGASGYLAGRAIWLDAFQHFPDWTKMRAGLETESLAYVREINALTEARATPWHRHGSYGPDGPGLRPADGSFQAHYKDFG